MLGFRSIRLSCLMLVAMLTLALGMAGAGHRVPTIEHVQLQGYQLAGLSIELCGKNDHGAQMPACPICTLIGAAVIPQPCDSALQIERQARAAIYLPLLAQSRHRLRDPTTPVRGPPLSQAAGQIV